MLHFKTPSLFLAAGLIASGPAFAANFCIAVDGGFGNGGTSFVGPSFAVPAAGNCKPWAGFTKTEATVIAFASGSGCLSNNGKVLTFSMIDTDPANFGTGKAVADQIVLCPTAVADCPISGNDQGNFSGAAAEETCTNALLKLPVAHD
jgi:hypothetical protein